MLTKKGEFISESAKNIGHDCAGWSCNFDIITAKLASKSRSCAITPQYPSCADKIVEPRLDMYIKVTAFSVT